MDPLKPDEFKIDSLIENGLVKPELVSDSGEKNIRNLIDYLTEPVQITKFDERSKREKKRNVSLTINQLRKYYDSFIKIFINNSTENEKKIQLLMLKANSEYSAKRLGTERFKIFMNNRISVVVATEGNEFNQNMKALKLHLEALVAYYPKN